MLSELDKCDGMISAVKMLLKRTPVYSYRFLYRESKAARSWSEEDDRRLQFYRELMRSGDLVFDIGANVGTRVKVFLRLGTNVIAVEPQRLCTAVLRKAFGDKVRILNCAMSHEIGRAGLRLNESSRLASMSPEWIVESRKSGRLKERWGRSIVVPTTTLDTLIADYGLPRFIKIDVEGHELMVLSGLSHPVPSLSFEFHPEILPVALSCIEKLESLGNYEYNFSYGEDSMALHLKEWITAEGIVDFLRNERVNDGDVYARI
jgi:FkbM family methyltransferase